MRTQIIKTLMLAFMLSIAGITTIHAQRNKITDAPQEIMFTLLHEWCDALLDRQVSNSDPSLNGGILCPACALIHGRCPDAIYPFLYVAACTGETKYVDGAKKVFDWGERNARSSDGSGSWNNEVNLYTWRGITVFGLITLAESMKDFQALLDQKTRDKWMNSIREQADFIFSFITKPGVGTINYPASTCYALALVGELTGDPKYTQRAKELAVLVSSHFTENDLFFYGEGEFPYVKSAKGLLPVDLGYNVEESLPNLLFYADLVGDTILKNKLVKSFRNHIEFMLPDGAWDNSWGTRNYKWSYWGSRTSDGVVTLCSALAPDDPLYATVGYRNIGLLRKCTYQGLLYGGMHYRSAGYPACIHHTFDHAKSLAMALHKGFEIPEKQVSLPREEEYGSRYFQDLDSWLIATGDWRATVSGYDVGYTRPGGNTHGGALSLLWHHSSGPVLAAGMTKYSIVESANMQLIRGKYDYSPTFQVIYEEDNVKYSNANSKYADIIHRSTESSERLTVKTELVAINSSRPASGKIPIEIIYVFEREKVTIKVRKTQENDNRIINLHLPVISQAGEESQCVGNGIKIIKPKGTIRLSGNKKIEMLPVETNGRAFCPVPGFEFIPLYMQSADDLEINIEVI